MELPTRDQADQLIREAESRNPGPWIAHSINVAQAAERIAAAVSGAAILAIHPNTAYTLGLLHDIGRREGVTDMQHIIDGYRYLSEMGFEAAARICLTHSFPLQDVCTMDSNWDGTLEDREFIRRFLEKTAYTPYDRLIQLCDSLALPQGFCLIEKRLVEVALRRGINDLTVEKWKAFFAIQRDFEQQLGHSIYQVLPGVIETTFGMGERQFLSKD